MGKTKGKKRGKLRDKPTGLPSVRDALEEQDQSNGNLGGKTLPLLQKLSSSTLEEKQCACAGLANLVFEPGAVPVLLNQDVVRRLGPLLIDSNRSVQEAAAGALRNLSVSGGTDVCVKMVEQDLMTPLTSFIKQSLESLTAVMERPENSKLQQQTVTLVIQAISLLWNVCESSATAVEIFNAQGLLPNLVLCLNTDIYPVSLAIPAAQCLHTVTEDNTMAAQALCGNSELMKCIEKSLMAEVPSSSMMLVKVLSAGILYNVRHSIPVCGFSELVQAVVKVLSQVLDVNCFDILAKMLPEVKKADDVLMLLNAQQLSLEILANVCYSDDSSEDEWEDVSDVKSDTSDEEFDEDAMQQQDADMVLEKALFGDIKIYESLSSLECGKEILTSLSMVQTRALICLNNITAAMETELLGGMDALGQLWTSLFDLTYSSDCRRYVTSEEDFLEAATGVMRSLMDKFASARTPQYVTTDQVSILCQCTTNASCEAIRVKLISTLGYIGKLAATRDDTGDVLKSLGVVLRDIAVSPSSLWVVAEALDAIFDTFADGPLVTSIASSIHLLVTLQQLVPVLKSRVKSERRLLGEHTHVVDAAKTNLTRFIKYYKNKGF
ncbi:HEAT repeat-containing protein 3 isoform X2 [Nematostella vectensis]|uniref:HEAT repeat-containing protein 3 isoform X2 n=1 Tax=Nematostella vectensis TaxID=45351 RepID=UPI00207789B5|nr:HEAT repeat-containing protein 3 isoform X2 [Nematostella vectensis]